MKKVYDNLDWNRTHKNFGEVIEGTSKSFTFVYYGDRKIKDVKTSCNCTSSRSDKNSGSVSITLKGRRISPRVKKAGQYHQVNNQTATVHFEDGSTQRLELTATYFDKEVL